MACKQLTARHASNYIRKCKRRSYVKHGAVAGCVGSSGKLNGLRCWRARNFARHQDFFRWRFVTLDTISLG